MHHLLFCESATLYWFTKASNEAELSHEPSFSLVTVFFSRLLYCLLNVKVYISHFYNIPFCKLISRIICFYYYEDADKETEKQLQKNELKGGEEHDT